MSGFSFYPIEIPRIVKKNPNDLIFSHAKALRLCATIASMICTQAQPAWVMS